LERGFEILIRYQNIRERFSFSKDRARDKCTAILERKVISMMGIGRKVSSTVKVCFSM